MNRIVISSSLVFALIACGGGGGSKNSQLHKKPNQLTTKPASARPMGMVTGVTPPNGGPMVSTQQPGDAGDLEFCWSQDVDDDGDNDDCCMVEDDETGDSVLACAPYQDSCEGGDIDGAFLMIEHHDGTGFYALASHDICGTGYDLFGCHFGADGEQTTCGGCTDVAGQLVCDESE